MTHPTLRMTQKVTKNMPKSISSPLLIFTLLLCLLSLTSQHNTSCVHPFPPISGDRTPSDCKKLATLGAEFGWKLHSHDSHNLTRVDIYFGATLQSGWMAWGVNPTHVPKMVGTRAIIGIMYQNGSSQVKTYNITGLTRLGCPLVPSDIDVIVQNMSSEYAASSGYFKMYATMFLNESSYNVSRLNHVWQVGLDFVESMPKMHGTRLQNCDSTETIDLNTGRSLHIGLHRMHMRTVHGILNIVGWGTLMPIGVIIARYTRRYPIKLRIWFRIHIFCQISGYVLGSAGWGIGLWLGHASKGYSFPIHKLIAIFIFTFTTVQMIALRLKPRSADEYRTYWNMYHHFLGYALLILMSVNIFLGIAILHPRLVWKWAYLGVLGVLSTIVVLLELFTWGKFLFHKLKKPNNNIVQEVNRREHLQVEELAVVSTG